MPALYSITTRADGLILTAAIYNADHQNHIDNGIPAQLDDYSADVATMQTTADPGESATVPTLATSLAVEITYLRNALKELSGHQYWYQSPEIASSKVAIEMFT